MTKANSKRRARKARRDNADPFALAPVVRRERDGTPKRSHRADYERDASAVALKARCRMAGWAETELDRARMQSLEGQAGIAITIGARNDAERQRLWAAYAGLDATEETYFRRVLGKSRHAKTAKLEMMPPEAIETRPDDKPDLRDEDQKHRDAVNGWMRWRGYLGHLRSDEQTAIHGAMQHRAALAVDGRLTTAGASFVAAMRVFSDVVERK